MTVRRTATLFLLVAGLLVAFLLDGGKSVGTALTTRADAQPARTLGAATPGSASYRLDLRSDDSGRRWTGRQRITFANTGKAALRTVWLRLWGNGPGGCNERSVRIGDVRGASPGEFAVDCTALPLRLAPALAPHASRSVSFNLTIRPPEAADRFGTVGDYTFLGNAVPLLAVHDDDGWHLPPYLPAAESFYSLTADFWLRLEHPVELGVPVTGEVVARERHGDTVTTMCGLGTSVTSRGLSDPFSRRLSQRQVGSGCATGGHAISTSRRRTGWQPTYKRRSRPTPLTTVAIPTPSLTPWWLALTGSPAWSTQR